MPHYDNDNPTIINVGLEYDEIEQTINIIDETYHDIETYRKEAIRLQQEVDRLGIKLDAAREKFWEVEE
jgi:DNA repair ATPase RecN